MVTVGHQARGIPIRHAAHEFRVAISFRDSNPHGRKPATFSASAGKNINTGTLLAVTSRADLERMAMPLGMTRLHGELHRGVNAIDSLRIAANADTASLMWQAEKVISGPRAR